MTLGRIKCFMTVAAEQSFAKAANLLFISQPAISKSVANLEEELGFALLDRKSRELQLTPAGRKLYDLFIRTENDYKEILGEIQQIIAASSETIRIGCPDTWNPSMFYDRIMAHFQEGFPSIRLEIEGSRMPELAGKLQAGKLDLILTYEQYRPLQYGFSSHQLTDTGCGLLYSREHYDIRSLADLKDTDILIFDVDVEKQFGNVLKSIFGEYGYTPKITNFSRFTSAIFNMACGKGVMLYTEWDNIAANTAYGAFPLPNRVPVNLLFQSLPGKPGVELVAEEMAKLFSAKT